LQQTEMHNLYRTRQESIPSNQNTSRKDNQVLKNIYK